MNGSPELACDPARRDAITDPNRALHRRLADFNLRRLGPVTSDAHWRDDLRQDLTLSLIEGQFIEAERRVLQSRLDEVPTGTDDFMAWFESLHEQGRAQNDALLTWLATSAPEPDLLWFLQQDVACLARRDDLVALTRLRMPPGPRLAMSCDFGDEPEAIGALRGPDAVPPSAALGPSTDQQVWESLALGNLMFGLGANRRYAYQSVGALGSLALTTPPWKRNIEAGLQRLGLMQRPDRSSPDPDATRSARVWVARVVRVLVQRGPTVAHMIAEGALLRFGAVDRCFVRYRRVLMPVAPYPVTATYRRDDRGSRSPISFR